LQGFVFAIIGLGAGVVGTATSNGLLALRMKMDPNYQSAVGGWALVVLLHAVRAVCAVCAVHAGPCCAVAFHACCAM